MGVIKITAHLSLKALSLADQPSLIKLMTRIYPSAYGHYWKDDCSWYLSEQYGLNNLEKELKEKNSFYYLVHFRQSVIGILRLRAECSYLPIPEKKSFKVHRLYLDPVTQGKGIGRLLMEYATIFAQQTGHELIWLDAMDTHLQAQGFYKSLGFTSTQSQQLPYDLLLDEHRKMWYMHKMLG